MAFQIKAWLHYEVYERSTVLLGIHALSSRSQTLKGESFIVTPGVNWEELPRGPGETRYLRIDTREATQLDISYSVSARTRYSLVSLDEIHRIPI